MLYQIIHRYHALQRVSKELLIAGVDTTSILIKSYFSALGYCGLTKRIEEGIKLHIGAVLGKFTIPLTAWVTPLNVSDSDEFDNVLSNMGLFVDLHKVILVFDKGYWNYQRFKELAERSIMFTTQMKKKAEYTSKFNEQNLAVDFTCQKSFNNERFLFAVWYQYGLCIKKVE